VPCRPGTVHSRQEPIIKDQNPGQLAPGGIVHVVGTGLTWLAAATTGPCAEGGAGPGTGSSATINSALG
jgi:hypothetical protein